MIKVFVYFRETEGKRRGGGSIKSFTPSYEMSPCLQSQRKTMMSPYVIDWDKGTDDEKKAYKENSSGTTPKKPPRCNSNDDSPTYNDAAAKNRERWVETRKYCVGFFFFCIFFTFYYLGQG